MLCHPHRSQPDIRATAPKVGVCAAAGLGALRLVASRCGVGQVGQVVPSHGMGSGTTRKGVPGVADRECDRCVEAGPGPPRP